MVKKKHTRTVDGNPSKCVVASCTSYRLVGYPSVHGVLYIQKGGAGFLNHQQYVQNGRSFFSIRAWHETPLVSLKGLS